MPPRKRPRLVEPEAVDIDPQGDFFVSSGQDPTFERMRVSRDVMTTSSAVFRAMLKPNFAEGLKHHTVEDPLVLPEDDPHALKVMLRLLHQTITDAAEIDPDHFHEFLLLCDKYDVMKSSIPWLQAALSRWREGSKRYILNVGWHVPKRDPVRKLPTTVDALCAAYFINDSVNFGHLSHELFLVALPSEIRSKEEFGGIVHDLMPETFREGMAVACKSAIKRAMRCYYEPLAELSYEDRERPSTHEPSLTNRMCKPGETRALHYMKTLFHNPAYLPPGRVPANFNPVNKKPFRGWNVVPIAAPTNLLLTDMQKLGTFVAKDEVEQFPVVPEAEKCHLAGCMCQRPLEVIVREVHVKAEEALGRVCLKCFKEGVYKGVVGKCKHAWWPMT